MLRKGHCGLYKAPKKGRKQNAKRLRGERGLIIFVVVRFER